MAGPLHFSRTAVSWLGLNCFCLRVVTRLEGAAAFHGPLGLALNTASEPRRSLLWSEMPLEEGKGIQILIGFFVSSQENQVTYGRLSRVETWGGEMCMKREGRLRCGRFERDMG